MTPLNPGDYNTGPSKSAAAKKSGLTADKIANYLAMGFNMWASFRGDHWAKTADQMAIIAEPLATWLEQQDAATKKAFEKYSLPGAIIFGLLMVLQEPISYEIEYANERRAERDARRIQGQAGQRQGQATVHTLRPARGEGVVNGSNPAGPPVDYDIPTSAT